MKIIVKSKTDRSVYKGISKPEEIESALANPDALLFVNDATDAQIQQLKAMGRESKLFGVGTHFSKKSKRVYHTIFKWLNAADRPDIPDFDFNS